MEHSIGKDMGQREHDMETVKEARLRRDREYRKEKRNAEPEPEKEKRLDNDRENKRLKRQAHAEMEREEKRARREQETDAEKEIRLGRDRDNKRLKKSLVLAEETVTEQASRLERDRANKKKRREEQRTELLAQNSVADRALETMFEDKMKKLGFSVCLTCKRKEMTGSAKDLCAKCSRKSAFNLFTRENRMDPGEVPLELKDLSPLEELLIAKVHPVVSLYKTKGQQLHYSGNVINFPQDVKGFSNKLPNIQAATGSV